MGVNDNNDLGLDSVFANLHNKENQINNNVIDVPSKKAIDKGVELKEKSQSITFTFDKEYFGILKKHFKDKGLMSQSIGIRSVLIEYMKRNGLIE